MANNVGPAVGSRAMTMAIIVAAVFEAAGAAIAAADFRFYDFGAGVHCCI